MRHRPTSPTTSGGVEFVLMAAGVGARMLLLLQILASVPTGIALSPRPTLYGVYVALGVGWSVVYVVVVTRRRRPAGAWTVRADVAVAAGCLLLQPEVVPTGGLVDAWTSWGYVLALNVVCTSCSSTLARVELTGVAVVISALYLVTRLSDSPVARAAVLSNLVGLLMFPALVQLVSGYLRRLGGDADAARAAAAAAERERHQLLLHDSATLLRLLAADRLPAELAAVVRRQAASESHRIQRFLADRPGAAVIDDRRPIRLADLAEQAADTYADLPLEVVTDLAVGVELGAEGAEAVRMALSALLNNIRIHSGATHVVLHADRDLAGWELVLRDDGVGFDPTATGAGFGLEVQVRRTLAANGITVEIRSTPGAGTVAVLRGRDRAVGPRGRAARP